MRAELASMLRSPRTTRRSVTANGPHTEAYQHNPADVNDIIATLMRTPTQAFAAHGVHPILSPEGLTFPSILAATPEGYERRRPNRPASIRWST